MEEKGNRGMGQEKVMYLMCGGDEIKVEFLPNLREENGTLLYGQFEEKSRTIRINTDFDERAQMETLLHELLHYIEKEFDLEIDETIIRLCSHNLYSVIVQNNLDLTLEVPDEEDTVRGDSRPLGCSPSFSLTNSGSARNT